MVQGLYTQVEEQEEEPGARTVVVTVVVGDREAIV
jgi:hypothetical protein